MAVKKKSKTIKAETAHSDLRPTLQESGQSHSARSKQYNRSMSKIQESHPMSCGTYSEGDLLWRSITHGGGCRDLNPMTQKRMRNIAFWLWDTNPIGHRIIEIMADFIIGDGFKVFAEDEDVQEVIDKFWNDSDNNIEEAQNIDVRELSLFGELCFPVWVNPADGHVKLGYLDPGLITKVTKNPKNPRMLSQVRYSSMGRPNNVKSLKIVNVDRNVRSKTFGYQVGECLYYTINKIWSNTRGRSDLLPLADWLDGHDQFLFARLERAFFLNNYIWDVTCEGMGKADLEKFVKTIPVPKPGSIRAHNEKITWNTVSPKLESADASAEADLFKKQILGGAGYPEHWFSEGSNTTRATALEMSIPTLKRLKSRQKMVKFMYQHMLNFQIDQAIIAGRLKKDVNRKFCIQPDPIISRDNKGMAVAVKNLTEGLISAESQGWITDEEASTTFRLLLSQCGAEFDRTVRPNDRKNRVVNKNKDDKNKDDKIKDDKIKKQEEE